MPEKKKQGGRLVSDLVEERALLLALVENIRDNLRGHETLNLVKLQFAARVIYDLTNEVMRKIDA